MTFETIGRDQLAYTIGGADCANGGDQQQAQQRPRLGARLLNFAAQHGPQIAQSVIGIIKAAKS